MSRVYIGPLRNFLVPGMVPPLPVTPSLSCLGRLQQSLSVFPYSLAETPQPPPPSPSLGLINEGAIGQPRLTTSLCDPLKLVQILLYRWCPGEQEPGAAGGRGTCGHTPPRPQALLHQAFHR
jgi:hypothetical protein